MKKIIAVFDGLKYSESTQNFAIEIANNSKAFLTGIFLEDFTYTSYKIHDLVYKEGVSAKELRRYQEKDVETRDKATLLFDNACKVAGISYNIHHDRNIAIKELTHESIYADLLIIDSRETLSHYQEEMPARFIQEILAGTHCPALVVPQTFLPIEKVALLYDGDPASVIALKMFSYLFAFLKHIPLEIISGKGWYGEMHLPDGMLMRELIRRHYPGATYTMLNGEPEKAIITHLKRKNENLLIVLGAYNRNTISRWFRKSMADTVMKELKCPVFIAHSK